MKNIEMVRQILKSKNLYALLHLNTDPHLSQYVSKQFRFIQRLTSFKGSNALLFISLKQAIILTDPRYEGFKAQEPFKVQIPQSNTQFLKAKLQKQNVQNLKILICPSYFNRKFIKNLNLPTQIKFFMQQNLFQENQITVNQSSRSLLLNKFVQPSEYKLNKIKKLMQKEQIQKLILNNLIDIGYILNIRQVNPDSLTPLMKAYMIISSKQIFLYTDTCLDQQCQDHLKINDIQRLPYKKFINDLKNIKATTIGVTNEANLLITELVKPSKIVTFLQQMRACKSKQQISGFRLSCLKDAIALAKLRYWIQHNQQVNQFQVASKLKQLRAYHSDFLSQSFQAIVGAKQNGAIIHYRPQIQNSKKIKNKMVLVDSGGQYLSGTTDVTRTFHLGEPTEQQKFVYTIVLKSILKLQKTTWKENTIKIKQLDAIPRQVMNHFKLNYPHSTGHGVAFCSNVHQYPTISKFNQNYLTQNMVITNQPGCYLKGKFGVRIQNMMVTILKNHIFSFENLTRFPYQMKLIQQDLLNKQQIQYITQYHNEIYEQIKQDLTQAQRKWLLGYISW